MIFDYALRHIFPNEKAIFGKENLDKQKLSLAMTSNQFSIGN
jgi:hypothetical protein